MHWKSCIPQQIVVSTWDFTIYYFSPLQSCVHFSGYGTIAISMILLLFYQYRYFYPITCCPLSPCHLNIDSRQSLFTFTPDNFSLGSFSPDASTLDIFSWIPDSFSLYTVFHNTTQLTPCLLYCLLYLLFPFIHSTLSTPYQFYLH